MQIKLLGPVEVWSGSTPLDAGPTRQRGVLAALAVDVGRPVLVDTLVDRVWGQSPPLRARHALYVYITRIRKMLACAGVGSVVRRSNGYVLDVEPGSVDIQRFRQLTAEADAPGCPPVPRLTLLRQAVDTWQGEPMADLTGEWPLAIRQQWREEHLETLDRWATAEVEAGNPNAPVRHLTRLIEQYPLAESLLAALLRALQAAGRNAEALDWYERTRKRLVEELGTDPSPDLQEVYRSIVNGEPGPTPAATPSLSIVPAQLPLDAPGFTGRAAELAELDALVIDAATGTVVVSALWGTAGVGKTALSVHWAHRVRDRFPDGQLFVNLRGFGPSNVMLQPSEVLRDFLEALGVQAARIPSDLDARAALYRSVLAGRRVLVLIDNARDADHARPLLPGTTGCLAVVTSRNRLTSLVAIEGARPVRLDVLTPDEAEAMLAERLGTARVTAEAEVVERLSTACSRLPIALAIVAAQASSRPDLTLRSLADQLGGSEALDILDGGDPSSDVRTVFSWSYRALTPDAARLFRLLGLHPGPSTTVAAAASLGGVTRRAAANLLDELTRANLAAEHVPGRFILHDLLHAYAGDLVARTDDDAERRAATHRLLDHYLHSADHAAKTLHAHQAPMTLAPPQPGTSVVRVSDAAAALVWFSAEDPVLLGLIRLASPAGFDTHTWQLTRSRELFALRQGRWSDLIATQHTALEATRRTADRAAEAHVHRSLARCHIWLGGDDQAYRHCLLALDLFEKMGDRTRQAQTEHTLTEYFDRRGDHQTALEHAYRALALYEATSDWPGTARALNAAGWCHALLGDHSVAVEHCERALTLFRAVGDPDGEAATCGSLGYAYQRLGRLGEAVDYYRQAIHLCGELGERFYQADTLVRLGDTHLTANDETAARAAWQRALEIFTELEHPNAAEVRARLAPS
jgi:DNA-binding SARP family transcriptional activator